METDPKFFVYCVGHNMVIATSCRCGTVWYSMCQVCLMRKRYPRTAGTKVAGSEPSLLVHRPLLFATRWIKFRLNLVQTDSVFLASDW